MRTTQKQLYAIRRKRAKSKAQKLYRVESDWFSAYSQPMYCYPTDPRFCATTTSV